MELHDRETLLAAFYDDDQLFATIYNRYKPELYAIALPICGHDYADDAVQDAMITAYLKFRQLRDIQALRPWLKRITVNCSYQILRKKKVTIQLEHLTKEMIPVEDSINRHIESLSERDHLYASLENISPVLQQPLILRYFSAYSSYIQIAEVLNIPVGTVRSRLSAGRTELIKQWHLDNENVHAVLDRSRQWNEYYKQLMPQIHHDHSAFSEFKHHLNQRMEIVLTSEKRLHGRDKFIDSIYDDLKHGSTIAEASACITCGNTSVMRVKFLNSPEYPNHCPPGSLLVIERDKKSLKRLKLYHASRQNLQVGSNYA